jgi:ankyrin repeat protein
MNGHVGVLHVLVQAKADVDKASTDDGTTPAFMAAMKGHVDVLQVLVQANADITKSMLSNGWSPLFVAAGAGNLEAVRLLLECAPEQLAVASTGEHRFWGLAIKAGLTPLDVARELQRDDVVQVLLFARGGEQ